MDSVTRGWQENRQRSQDHQLVFYVHIITHIVHSVYSSLRSYVFNIFVIMAFTTVFNLFKPY